MSISGNEDILTEKIGGNLTVINPNKVITNKGVKDRLVNHEDLVIYANLVAKIVPRSKILLGDADTESEVAIDLFGGEVNFLKPKGKKSLDSSWTEAFTNPDFNKITYSENEDFAQTGAYTKSLKEAEDFQGFGITSINVVINQSFVPEVTINFTDIRGKTLFEQGDTGGPYTAFFHMPYPVFHLTLKGYYGTAVKYQLKLMKFNAAFDSSSGDYNITCKFIGNHSALLNDLNLHQAMIAPYMYPSPTRGEGGVSTGLGMQIMNEVYQTYEDRGLIKKDFPRYTIFALMNKVNQFETELASNFKKEDLQFMDDKKTYQDELTKFYNSIFGTGQWFDTFLDKTTATVIPTNVTASAGTENIVAYQLLDATDSGVAAANDAWVKRKDTYVERLNSNLTFGETGQRPITVSGRFDVSHQIASGTSSTLEGPYWYIVDKKSESFGIQWLNVQKEFEKNFNELQTEVSKNLNKTFVETLGFYPSIRNLHAVILAGSDTFIRLLDRVHTEAFKQRNNQKRLRVLVPEDVKNEEKTVFPWPIYYEETEDNERILQYPGASKSLSITGAYDAKLWPEVEFVEEYTKASAFHTESINAPFENQFVTIDYIPLSVREFPFDNEVYGQSAVDKMVMEIYDRSFDLLNYGSLTWQNRSSDVIPAIQELAQYDAEVLEKRIKLNSNLATFFGNSTVTDINSIFEYFNNEKGQDVILRWQLGLPNTSYISQRNIEGKNIPGTNYGVYPGYISFIQLVETKPYTQVLNYIHDQKSDSTFDMYPLRWDMGSAWIQETLANGQTADEGSFYTTKEIQLDPEAKLFSTQNLKYFLCNHHVINEDPTNESIINDEIISTKDLKTKEEWESHYQGTDGKQIKHITEGLNHSGDYTKVLSLFNTPYFANALAKGYIEKDQPGAFLNLGYMFLQSLPIATTKEKMLWSPGNYGSYISQILNQLAAHHQIPLAFALKIGSIWWRYKTAGITNPDTDADNWDDAINSGTLGYFNTSINTGTGPEFLYTDSIMGLGFSYTLPDGTIATGDNGSEISLGIYPKLMAAAHYMVTGQDVLSPVVDDATLLNNFNISSGFSVNVIKETDASFNANNQQVNYYTTYGTGNSVTVQSTIDTAVSTAGVPSGDYYILYPSAGGMLSNEFESAAGVTSYNNQVGGHNGSVRFLWSLPQYGYFSGDTFPARDQYYKKIFNDKDEQDIFAISNGGTELTQRYSYIDELLAVFPTEVLNYFEDMFKNFCQRRNPSTEEIEGEYTSLHQVLGQILYVPLSDVKLPDQGTGKFTSNIAAAQHKKAINILETFTQQKVFYKKGSVNNLDNVINIDGNPIQSYQALVYLLRANGTSSMSQLPEAIQQSWDQPFKDIFFPYNNNLPPDIPLATFMVNNPGLYSTFQYYFPSAFGGIDMVTVTNSPVYEFFREVNIAPTEENVPLFAPIIRTYYSNGNNLESLGELETTLSQTQNQYLEQLFNNLKKIEPDTKEEDAIIEDDRPLIVADNLKLELYQSFKHLNDAWIAGLTGLEDRTLLEKFYFLDRANEDIGDEAVIDIFIMQQLGNPFTPDPSASVDRTLNSFLSKIAMDNNFLKLDLPSYINFFGVGDANSSSQGNAMFGTFTEVDTTKSGPVFLYIYIGEESTHLSVKTDNYGFNNDSFDLNKTTPNPLVRTTPLSPEKQARSNAIMAYTVDFGIPNQNVFTSINLDQSQSENTSESYIVLDDLALAGGGKNVSTNSLNLFNVYKTRSYNCSVEAMGCALIQPTQYFQLRYVPMFSGVYMIKSVEHSIAPNTMTTKFEGVRIPIPNLPKVTDLITRVQTSLLEKVKSAVEKADSPEEVPGDMFDFTEEELNRGPEEEGGPTNQTAPIAGITFSAPVDISKVEDPRTIDSSRVSGGPEVGDPRSGGRVHKGVDLYPKTDFMGEELEITAAHSGKITKIVRNCLDDNTVGSCGGGYGNHVRIVREIVEWPSNVTLAEGTIIKVETRYCHLKRGSVAAGLSEGQEINDGVFLGHMGATGNASPGKEHLHYEVRVTKLNSRLAPITKVADPLEGYIPGL